MSTKTKIGWLSFLLATSIVCARPYKYYLDPNHAEEILSRFGDRQPHPEGEWLSVVGARRYARYSVVQGDTLWGVSTKLFGKSGFWPKLWEVNPQITNPHQLDVGQLLAYYNQADRGLASLGEIPVIKLVPNEQGKATDIDNDAIINIDVKNRYRPSLFVLTPNEPFLGYITGSYSEKKVLGAHEEVYLAMEKRENIKIGDRFDIVHLENTLYDNHKVNSRLGTLVRLVGEVAIIGFGDRLVKGDLVGVFNMIQRGDQLIAVRKPVEWSIAHDPPEGMSAVVLMGEDTEYKIFRQGQVVLLNKGTEDGMKDGYYFRVHRDRDLSTEKTDDVEPDYKGEIQVIYTGERSSVGYIMRNTVPILIGDTLLPRQLFQDPLPKPHRSGQVQELP